MEVFLSEPATMNVWVRWGAELFLEFVHLSTFFLSSPRVLPVAMHYHLCFGIGLRRVVCTRVLLLVSLLSCVKHPLSRRSNET